MHQPDGPVQVMPRIRNPGKRIGVRLRDEEFVIAFDKADLQFRGMPAAPIGKTFLFGNFVSVKRDPELEDVAEKNDSRRFPRSQGIQHAEKTDGFLRSALKMRVRDQNIPFLPEVPLCFHGAVPKLIFFEER